MTRSRASVHREIFGLLGRFSDGSQRLRFWNDRFAQWGMDATMERYSCSFERLHEAFSAMLHFDRRGYVIAPVLQKDIVHFLDIADERVLQEGRVDTIVQVAGVFSGYWVDDDDDERMRLWFGSPVIQ